MTSKRPLDGPELVASASERDILEAFLDYYRETLVFKVRGLSEREARRRLVPSMTTPIGLLKHCAAVERNWFQHRLGEKPREQIDGNAYGNEASWAVSVHETVEDVIRELGATWAVSREIASYYALDHDCHHERLGLVSLRWIYIHMIEEYARHVGHADILREQIDGRTGDP